MPEEGIRLLSHEEILSFDEIAGFTEVAVRQGITKVRITGGEPLVRKGVVKLVEMIAAIGGIDDLSMTTNGILLGKYAFELKEAGLHRVNISLDTTDPERFAFISRGGNVDDVMSGIEAAIKAGLIPVKINCVIERSADEEDAKLVTDFCARKNLEIRYIKRMDLVRGHFSTVLGGTGGNCRLCNRLRLTSNGILKPCLFSDLGLDIRKMTYEEAVRTAVEMKPEYGLCNHTGEFYNIGG
jgi:cyclic pyranopterin phosphate synthase